jgi:MFS family permease
VFTLASAACGISQTAAEVIAARAFQGLGAALFVPQTMAVIIAIVPAGHSYTSALRDAIVVPVVALLAGAALALALRQVKLAAPAEPAEEARPASLTAPSTG